jgi:hypothetical protein
VNAQEWPIAASRLFFVRRRVTVRDLPESRVTGAQPAKACSARSSANRSRSSPISAHDRAADVGQAAGEAGDDLIVRVLRERLD